MVFQNQCAMHIVHAVFIQETKRSISFSCVFRTARWARTRFCSPTAFIFCISRFSTTLMPLWNRSQSMIYHWIQKRISNPNYENRHKKHYFKFQPLVKLIEFSSSCSQLLLLRGGYLMATIICSNASLSTLITQHFKFSSSDFNYNLVLQIICTFWLFQFDKFGF